MDFASLLSVAENNKKKPLVDKKKNESKSHKVESKSHKVETKSHKVESKPHKVESKPRQVESKSHKVKKKVDEKKAERDKEKLLKAERIKKKIAAMHEDDAKKQFKMQPDELFGKVQKKYAAEKYTKDKLSSLQLQDKLRRIKEGLASGNTDPFAEVKAKKKADADEKWEKEHKEKRDIERKKMEAHWATVNEENSHKEKSSHRESSGHREKSGHRETSGHREKSGHRETSGHKTKKNLYIPEKEKAAPPKPKPKPRPPPVPKLSFEDLMRIAQEKKNAPAVIVPKEDPKPKEEKKKGPNRPMTQKEREHWERKNTPEYKNWIKYGRPINKNKSKDDSNRSQDDSKRYKDDSKPKNSINPREGPSNTKLGDKMQHIRDKGRNDIASKSNAKSRSDFEGKNKVVPKQTKSYDSVNEIKLVCRPAGQAEKDELEKMNPWDRINSKYHKKPVRREPEPEEQEGYDSYEDEYDSDMSDFIDNEPMANDISSHIRDIFGYDKRKFKDEKFDDRSMEASFRDVMREEARSTRLGLKEDLEDIKAEEIHKKRKMEMKQAAMSGKKKRF